MSLLVHCWEQTFFFSVFIVSDCHAIAENVYTPDISVVTISIMYSYHFIPTLNYTIAIERHFENKHTHCWNARMKSAHIHTLRVGNGDTLCCASILLLFVSFVHSLALFACLSCRSHASPPTVTVVTILHRGQKSIFGNLHFAAVAIHICLSHLDSSTNTEYENIKLFSNGLSTYIIHKSWYES